MIDSLRKIFKAIWPAFLQQDNDHLDPYFTIADYHKIWTIGITILATVALFPLFVATFINYQLFQESVNSEIVFRTERVTSNTRRVVSFFLEERLDALRFTINEIKYDKLANPTQLFEILKNLKLGFGGLTDLSVIDQTGIQIAYAGPYQLEGKNYSNQVWFIECQKHNFYVSEIFRGYRDLPHIIIAVKSYRPDGTLFFLRATLETQRLIQLLSSYKTGSHADIFLVSRSGIIQTPSKYYGAIFNKMALPIPDYSTSTKAFFTTDSQERSITTGYAYISTQIADTPYILMVIKQKDGMMGQWVEFRSKMYGFGAISIVVIFHVVAVTCTYMVNKLYLADRAKAETMVLMEQQSQLASIGQLAAGVAHEINNPLALINETAGYVKDLFEIKKQYQNDNELLEGIDDILEAVGRCGTITKQLLGFAHKADIDNQRVNLKEIISDVLNFHIKESEYRNIKIGLDVPEDNLEIETDRGKLQQILLNLVNNAFQAVDVGSRIDVHASSSGPDKVVITVSDNGCGMSQAELAKVFEPFFTTKERGTGTGLGLAITYGLVKKLNGIISVESKENEGTRFLIILPTLIGEETDGNESSVG